MSGPEVLYSMWRTFSAYVKYSYPSDTASTPVLGSDGRERRDILT